MKFLKEYKIFESHSKIEDIVRDALQDLTDDGYGLSVQICDTHMDVRLFSKSELMGYAPNDVMSYGFAWSEIKENIEFLINYIKDEYYLYKIKIDATGMDFPEFQIFKSINELEEYIIDCKSLQDYSVIIHELSLRFKNEKTQ